MSSMFVVMLVLSANSALGQECSGTEAVDSSTTDTNFIADCNNLLAIQTHFNVDLDWNVNTNISDWRGVTVQNGRVTKLLLPKHGLVGTLPIQLGLLSELTILDLSQERIHGHSDRSLLGKAPNDLTGNISVLANLSKLQELWLGRNHLSGGIPAEFGDLSMLRRLDLFDNNLGGSIPPGLGNLDRLSLLSLKACGLTGPIPPELGKLSNLKTLRLSDNKFSGGIPKELGNLTILRVLTLDNIGLTGSIPKELGNLTILYQLNLELNSLSGEIPKELGNLSNLDELILFGNQLNGSIPKELGKLKNAFEISLYDNNLSGKIPKELGNLHGLHYLILSNNRLNGSIPKELGNMTELELLYLGNNQISGEIPEELGNLSELESLRLANNSLNGSIPEELGKLRSIRKLFLNNNSLNGTIPEQLRNIPSFFGSSHVKIQDNNLTGCAPFAASIRLEHDSENPRCPPPPKEEPTRRRSRSRSSGGGGGIIYSGVTLFPGQPHEFNVSASSVSTISVTSDEQVAKVEVSTGVIRRKPSYVENSPEGEVLEYLTINPRNLEDDQIRTVLITFVLSKEQLDSDEDIALLGYDREANQWEELETEEIRKTSDSVTFSAQTSKLSYSIFAIVSKERETSSTVDEEGIPELEEQTSQVEIQEVLVEDRKQETDTSERKTGSNPAFVIVAITIIVIIIVGVTVYRLNRGNKKTIRRPPTPKA